MTWYYHSGNTVRPVLVKPGLSKSVRPKSKVEILHMTPEVEALIGKGLLRRVGKPKGSESVAKIVVNDKKIEDVVEKPQIAKNIAEKGATISKNIAPVAANGPEKTEGELAVEAAEAAAAAEAEAEGEGTKEGDNDEEKAVEDGLSSEKTDDGKEKVDQAGTLNENGRKRLQKKRR